MPGQIKQIFSARVEEVAKMISFVVEQAELAEIHPKRVLQLQLAVEEVVVNICSYAYQKPPGEILVSIGMEQNRFVVAFVDEGIPFDPLTLEEPDISAGLEERQVGGLGIHLIRRIMDEFHYQRKGHQNITTLVVSS